MTCGWARTAASAAGAAVGAAAIACESRSIRPAANAT
jgi:hypothetical protein